VIRWWTPWLFVVGVVGCETTSVVGYNRARPSPMTCGPDSALALCNDNPCVVRELFAAHAATLSLAVDDEAVFFMRSEAILSRRDFDAVESSDLTTSLDQLSHTAVDAEHVYFTEFDAIVRRVPKHGGDTEVVMTPFGHPTQIVVDDRYAYTVLPDRGEIAMAPKVLGAMERLGSQAAPQSLTLDGEYVYWVNQGTAGARDGALVRARRGDLTTAEIVRADLDGPLLVAVGDTTIAWATETTVMRMNKTGGDPREVASGLRQPKTLGMFGETIYLAAETGLVAIPLDGQLKVLDNRPMTGLAVACSGVYANVWNEGQIVRYGK
jgi:hypothetical protein